MSFKTLLTAAALALLVLAAPVAHAQPPEAPTPGALYKDGPGGRFLLGGSWLFRYDRGVGLSQGFATRASTAGWQPVSVPNAWNATDSSLASFKGTAAWYRKDFLLPSAARGLTWIVRFESVNYHAIVWLNGHRIGNHDGAYLAFEIALPPQFLSRRGVNRLVVRVDNRRTHTDLPPTGTSTQTGEPLGGWWNYGGLLREVYLRRVDRVDFGAVQVLPSLPCATCAARIDFRVTLHNYDPRPQRVHLVASYGGIPLDLGTRTLKPGADAAFVRSLPIPHPQLWWPSRPYLYDAKLTAINGGAAVASYELLSGVRSVRVVAGHLLLNGAPLHLRGVGLHEDSPQQGFAIDNAARQRFMDAIKGLGATLVRAHYPLHPEFEELADENGVMLWSEIPVYQVKAQYLRAVTPAATAMLRQNILTNGNHPSVIAWSIANELSSSVGPSQAFYIRTAAAAAHALDPTRPVALAEAGYPAVGCQSGYGPLDLIGLNDYFGWYLGPEAQIADPSLLPGFLDEMRACYPHKALIVSEFGAEANRDGPVEERGTYQFQNAFISSQMGVFASRPYLSGAVYWALEDFRVRPGWQGGNPHPDPPVFQKGLLDYSGNPKPSYSLMQSLIAAVAQVG